MKVVGDVLIGIGFFGEMLFASGADLNEVSVTVGGMLACMLMMAAGATFQKAARIRRRIRRRRTACRGTIAAAGAVLATVAVFIGANTADTFPAMAAVETMETAEEPIMIEIHSERDVIEIDEAPPIETAEQAETAAAPTEETEPDEAAWFIYLEEVPLTREQQKTLYTMWTGAGYDYIMALALADKETGGTFSTTAVNHNTHDYGLFQLNRKSWQGTFKKMFGISSMDEMLDYELNIKGAIYVYGDCVRRYGETERAVVAYNMGSAKYDSTEYSRAVMENYRKWQAAYQKAKGNML